MSGPWNDKLTNSAKGILCILVGVSLLSIQDMTVKQISDSFSLWQIVLVRCSVALLITIVVFAPLEGGFHTLKTNRKGLQLLRGTAFAASNIIFFLSLASLSFPVAVVTFFTVPLIITLMAIPFLGESANPVKLLLVALGFIGALLVIQPGLSGFQITALLPLVAAIAYAIMALLTRGLAATESAASLALYTQICLLVMSGLGVLLLGDGRLASGDDPTTLFLLRAWVWPGPLEWLMLCGIGLINAIAVYLITQGYRIADVSRVAPFEYVAIPLSVLWGVMFWGDWPNLLAWIGTLCIVIAGLLVARRNLTNQD